MLHDQIRIDRNGQTNRQLLEAIRTQVNTACDGRLPFLLLPVRIETRFMQVDRPVQDDSASGLFDRLGRLNNTLQAVAQRDIATRLEDDHRKVVKSIETEIYRFLDEQLGALEDAHTHLKHCLRNCSGSTLEDAAELQRFAAEMRSSIALAGSNFANLRSEYQKSAYRERLDSIDRKVLTPIGDQLVAAARKLELTAHLRFIEVTDVRQQVAQLRALLDRYNRQGLRAYDNLERARDALYPLLHNLRRDVHAVLHGDADELQALHADWQQVDLALEKFQHTVAAVAVDNRYQAAGRTRTQTHIEDEYRVDLAALAGGSLRRFQVLSNKDFIASAEATHGITVHLEQQLAQLQQAAAAPSRLAAQTLAIAGSVLQSAQQVEALSRDISIIPSDRYALLTSLQGRVEQAWEPWSTRLEQLANSSGRDAVKAAQLRKSLTSGLAAQERAVFGQRTDVWDAYDRFYDDFRRKIFAIDTTRTETVDELWVRVYPDDIAVHTHEEPLTEDEERDGKAFWIEGHAADEDEELKKGAWRALVRLHGSRRAAWIARALQPNVTRPFSAGQRLLKAVVTLRRRVEENGASKTRLLRDPLKSIARIQSAADATLAALADTQRLTESQARQINRELRIILGRLGQITGRIDRRSRFIEQPRDIALALEKLAESLGELQQGVAALPVVSLREEVIASLKFPAVDQRDGPWTVAPHSKVMPDRFVALAVRDGEVVHAVAGEPVDDIKVGLDPDPENDDASLFRLDEEGRLLVGDSIRWMTDFGEAVAKGMGMVMRLSDEEADRGFDELFVLGVRSLSAGETAALVEQLLDNHHFNEEGLGFLPPGTPTNNTEERLAAWRSDDDPDASYPVEREGPLFDAGETDPTAKSDGLLFAEALGISPSVVANIDNSDGPHMAEAAVFNHALWPATIGAYLEDFLAGLVSTETIERLETFFTGHVSARGKLPALRVGSQPYGLVVTSAFHRFRSAFGNTLPPLPPGGAVDLSEQDQALRFDILLHDLLAAVAADWSAIRREKAAHAHSEQVNDAQQHFMQMLGLHATSVSADYRFALNIGNRHPARGPSSDVRMDHTSMGPDALLHHFEVFHRLAFDLGNDPIYTESGAIAEPFKALHDAIFDGRIYDVRYVHNARSLRGPLIGSGHADYVARLLNRQVDELLAEARDGNQEKRSLLFLMLRQALMVRMRFAALNILEREHMLTAEARARAGSADEFMVRSLLSTNHLTKWNYLFGDLRKLDGRFSIDFPSEPGTLFHYLTTAAAGLPGDDFPSMADYLAQRGAGTLYGGFPHHVEEVQDLQAHATAIERLATIPAARLELLLREHIDLCSHRLDAWQLGFANRRLAENRANAETASGLYLGAYGWVENLRPGGERQRAQNLPAALHIDGEAPVYTDEDNQGFIHCPSVNQAVTAAVLRSGYLTEADDTDIDNRMAVNLSSRRVRLALGLLDGVQSGQDLGILLGYRFERELHEAYQRHGATYDDLIYDFRRAFPGISSVNPDSIDPQQGRRVVTDGLMLLDTVQDWIEQNVDLDRRSERSLFEILHDNGTYSGHPWGLPDITPDSMGRDRREGVTRAIDMLADALDALGDLALAEGVYQIVRGNFPRAAAVLAALSEGRAMPTPQVVDTPRSGTTLTHRVLLPFNAVDGRDIASSHVGDPATLAANRQAALPPAWNHLPMTPRANAEPSLNRWIGELLGPPAQIRCLCGDPGAGLETSAEPLGLQPIDWLAMLGSGLEEAEAELGARLIEPLLPADADLGVTLDTGYTAPKVRFTERDPAWPQQVKTPFEVAALLGEASALLGKARAADADDLALDEQSVESGAADNPGWDLAEADARIGESRQRLRGLTVDLMQVLNGDIPPAEAPEAVDPRAWAESHAQQLPKDDALLARRSELAGLLLQAAGFGIRLALPPLDFAGREPVARSLRAALVNAFVHCAKRLQDSAAIGNNVIARHQETAKILFGKGFMLLPAFQPRNAAELHTQLASDSLLRHGGPFAMDNFLAGAAGVRDNLHRLQLVWTIGEAFGTAAPQVKPAQFPAHADDYWLGIEFPEDHVPQSDKLSLIVADTDAWDLNAGPVRALLIDQWTEVIPAHEETTGVSFFYDQPDAAPPQALLLAVSPRPSGNWRWEDLVHTLHDTLELARNRIVEPDHLDDTLYAQLLPAVLGELVPDLVGDSAVELTGSRAILDFGTNN